MKQTAVSTHSFSTYSASALFHFNATSGPSATQYRHTLYWVGTTISGGFVESVTMRWKFPVIKSEKKGRGLVRSPHLSHSTFWSLFIFPLILLSFARISLSFSIPYTLFLGLLLRLYFISDHIAMYRYNGGLFNHFSSSYGTIWKSIKE